jgi:putative ABC transport system permease protein
MTPRGRGALVLGAAVYLAAWAFGSRPLYPVAVGLALAAVGIYGILSYTVSRRRREIGIRLALGAEPRTIRRMVVRQGLTMAMAGCIVGLVGAQVGAGLLAKFIYETRASDPLTLAAVIAVALLACVVPGWRASAEDPTRALRAE